MQRKAILTTLMDRIGGAPDSSAVAEAALNTWHQMASRLAPVIGGRGVDALFLRSIHLTNAAFPWLILPGDKDSMALLASLRVCLEAREPAAAADASCALVVTFIDLLESLIGKALTERLLGSAWGPLPSAPEGEISP